MKGLLTSLTFILVAATLLIPPCAWGRPSASDPVFRNLVLNRIRAYGRGDYPAYRSLLDANFVHISDLGERRTRAEMKTYVLGHGDTHATYQIADLNFRVQGGFAVVFATVNEHSADHNSTLREADTFVWRHDRWLYQDHQETAVFEHPAVISIAQDILKDYPGRYVSVGGQIDIITVRGTELVAQSPGDATVVALLPIGPDAFALPGDPAVVIFVRSRTGVVTQCIWHQPSGQVITETRYGEAAQGGR